MYTYDIEQEDGFDIYIKDKKHGKKLESWLSEIHEKVSSPVEESKKPKLAVLYSLNINKLHDGNIILNVHLYVSSILKKGGYGKVRDFSLTAKTHQAALTVADEEILFLLRYLNEDAVYYSYRNNDFRLSGKKSSVCFEQILKTGRCYFDIDDKIIAYQSDDKLLELNWRLNRDSTQKLELLVSGETKQTVFLDSVWTLDLGTGECFKLNTSLDLDILRKLILSPQIPPEATKKISEELSAIIPKNITTNSLRVFERPKIKKSLKITPILQLFVADLNFIDPWYIENYNAKYSPKTEKEVIIAKVIFDYSGTKIPYKKIKQGISVEYIQDDELFSLKRNFTEEERFIEQLHMTVQLLMPDEIRELSREYYNRKDFMLVDDIYDEEDFTIFTSSQLPYLEQNGWIIERASPIFYEDLDADEVDWYSELEENSGYDYFGLEMGIILDGEKISILPSITKLIRETPIELLQNLNDEQSLPIVLENQRKMLVPFSRIKPITNILIELFDSTGDESAAIQISKYQASLLNEIKQAFQATKLRWFGGDKILDLSEKLSDFRAIQQVDVPCEFKAELRPYQQSGVNWLQFLREYELDGVLADDMGLGKTVQTLAHLTIEKQQNRMQKPTLIIAPTSLMVNWRLEAEKFSPALKILVFHGDNRHRQADVINSYNLVLTTYPLILRDKDLLLANEFHYLILDEAQFIKNTKSKTTQIVLQLKAKHRLCLTGTPMENHLGELWSLFNFLMPGFLGSSKKFNDFFRKPIEKDNDTEKRSVLANRVKPFMLRRTKDAVVKELPAKTEIIRTVELAGPQRDLYESIRLAMQKKVRDAIKSKGLSRSHIMILDALLKLRQTCCDPKILSIKSAQAAHEHSAKINLLMELLPNLVEEGRKVIIFSQFTKMLGVIEDELNKHKISFVKLTGSTKNREKPIQAFQNGEVPVFLISLKAGGTGLNLTAADTVIHYDPWWNPAVEDQATDRAHRIGQDKPVFVYKLIAKGTVEETIQQMQQKKRDLMEGLFSEQKGSKLTLTTKDLDVLFKPL